MSPAADSAMLDILRTTRTASRCSATSTDLTVPHKTGATDSVRTECALFRLQSRVVACGFTKQNTDTRYVPDNEAHVALGKIGAAVVAAWPRGRVTSSAIAVRPLACILPFTTYHGRAITVTIRRLLGLAFDRGHAGNRRRAVHDVHSAESTRPPIRSRPPSSPSRRCSTDSVVHAQMTNMKTWVDSAAGILPTPMTAVDSLGVATTTTTTTTTVDTTMFANGSRAPATASALPLLAAARASASSAPAIAVVLVEPARERVRVRARNGRA